MNNKAAGTLGAIGLAAAIGAATVALMPPSKDCRRAPVGDTKRICLRLDVMTGQAKYYGAGNRFPKALEQGHDCEPCRCAVLAGEDPDTAP